MRTSFTRFGNPPQNESNRTSVRRRWFSFSLRVLVLTCTLIAVALGLMAKKARDQEAAVQLVEQLGGGIIYGYQPDTQERRRRSMEEWERSQAGKAPVKYVDEPWTPQWLHDLVGKHWFITVSEVHLSGTLVTNDQLRTIGKLRSLRALHLSGVSNITGDGLANLQSLRRLELLGLSNNRWSGSVKGLSDQDLKHLRHHRRLKYLDLRQNRFTGAGIQELSCLDQLVELNLSATEITPTDLQHLTVLQDLEALQINDLVCDRALLEQLQYFPRLQRLPKLSSSICDLDTPLVARMEGLRHLNLDGTMVTDSGLKQLKELTGLEELWLDGSKITDAGLRELGRLPNLKTLGISARPESLVTDAGVAPLLEAGNSLEVVRLQQSSITDATLQRLQQHRSLNSLSIDGTNVTDRGLALLARMPELRNLSLQGTQVSDPAVRKLEQALPLCRIRWVD